MSPAVDVARVLLDPACDEREEALRVGVAVYERAVLAELSIEPVEVPDHAVVCEQPSPLLEGVGVLERDRPGRGVPDVGDERGRLELARLARELEILVGGDGLLADDRETVRVEHAEAGAVGLATALRRQPVLGVEQPERRTITMRRRAHSEQSAHGVFGPRRQTAALCPQGAAATSDLGMPDQVALDPVAPERLEHLPLLDGLDALADDIEPERVTELDDRPDDRGAQALADLRHERRVDLERVERQVAEPRERRVPGAEVVQADPHAQSCAARGADRSRSRPAP